MHSVLRQVNKDQAEWLLENPDEVFDFVDEEVPGAKEFELDKAWHGLHYLLTGTLWEGEEPLCYLVRGGQEVGDEDYDVGYGPARILNPLEVAAFSKALSQIQIADLRHKYSPADMTAQEVYPDTWVEGSEGNADWLLDSFEQLKRFVIQAAGANKALLIWLQ